MGEMRVAQGFDTANSPPSIASGGGCAAEIIREIVAKERLYS